MTLSAVLFLFVGIPVLLILWCVLQVYNTKQRQNAPVTAAKPSARNESATVVSLRAELDNAGELAYYATFNIHGMGRREFLVPAACYEPLAAGNRGELITEGDKFIRFEQDF